LEVPPDEFRLPFFDEYGFLRKRCPVCGSHYWTQNPSSENCGDFPCAPYTFIGNSPVNRRFTVAEMREKFLSFFEDRGHRRIPPYPVIARWRDDLMVTIASIVDFQPYVTEGIVPPPANPLVISQPCLRFEDIDLVGKTAGRHLTIFEMGGHHAFNYEGKPQIYWKDETVRFHHELLTRELGVPSEKVTYKEGLWSGGGNAGFDLEGCVDGLEISTLVFMMFRVLGSRLEPMPIRVVDTGYGIERWTWLSAGTPSAFHAVYGPILERALEWAGLKGVPEELLSEAVRHRAQPPHASGALEGLAAHHGYEAEELERLMGQLESIYAALDHTKSLTFILSEGVVPSNVKEGYLARLLYRRAYRLLRRVGLEERLRDLVEGQIGYWGADFPHLLEMREEIMEMMEAEEEKYRDTLRRGSSLVKRALRRGEISTERLVEFYDSHGLTPEDVREAASEEGFDVQVPGDFYSLVARRHMVRGAAERVERGELYEKVKGLDKTSLLFYEDPYMREFEARVVALIEDRYVVLDRTAFYAEAGGQLSDTGWLLRGSERARVINVQSVDGVLLHEVEAPAFGVGEEVRGIIDWDRRHSLMRSHTATHLLLGAARRVLGKHAWQAGAQKGVEASRLDISHHRRLTREDVERMEQLVNEVVSEGRRVTCSWMPREEAERRYGFRLYQGGVAPGREIRVVEVEGWDAEACGGTHVSRTSEVGLVKILGTERVQDGVERIIFSTGPHALREVQRRERILMGVAETLGAPIEHLERVVAESLEKASSLRKERDEYLRLASRHIAEGLLERASEFMGWKLIVETLEGGLDLLIEVGNSIALHSGRAIAVLASEREPRFIVKVGVEALMRGIHAGRVAGEIARVVGGGGGGEGHFGQGGGGDPRLFRERREEIAEILRNWAISSERGKAP
jgi:alanyl-tRNA synthetase